MNLQAWQAKVLRDIYGRVDLETGLRLTRDAYVSVAKQNGKSFLTGGLPIYHLLMESELDTEVYGCAAAREQAGIVFRATTKLVKANPMLQAELKVLDSIKRIVCLNGSGFYQVLSADGDVQDGIRPSLLIRDELHRWKSSKAEVLHDVTSKGQISRTEPLNIGITTAGAEYESPMWWREYQQARGVLDGTIKSDTLYVALWEADRKKLLADKDYWKSREARVAANPSHEDHPGGFLRDAAIVKELNLAINTPSEKPKYLRYHLNIPIQASEDPVIDASIWQENGDPVPTGEDLAVDLRVWPEYDYEMLVKRWGLEQRPCWVGVDASWTTDLTSVCFVFPPFTLDSKDPRNDPRGDPKKEPGKQISPPISPPISQSVAQWTLLPFFFIPRERIPQLERATRMPFAHWVDQGFVTATSGNGIDMRTVVECIRWGRETFNLIAVPYDRLNFRSEAMKMKEEGIPTIEVAQSFLHLSYATKFLLSAYMDRKLRHGNNPVLNWMASCLQLQYDHKDNCQPSKPERLKSSKRIDGVQAAVTALSQALIAPQMQGATVEVW